MKPQDRALADEAFDNFRKGLGGDQDALARFIDMMADDVVLNFPKTPRSEPPYVGKEAVRAFFFDFVIKVYNTGLFITPIFALEDEHRVAYLFADQGVMSNGNEYKNSVCITLEVREGTISRYWEFFGGPGYFLADGAPV